MSFPPWQSRFRETGSSPRGRRLPVQAAARNVRPRGNRRPRRGVPSAVTARSTELPAGGYSPVSAPAPGAGPPAGGPGTLPDTLLGAILGPPPDGIFRVRSLLGRFPLSLLSRMGAERLVGEGGLGRDQAARLEAAFELGRCVERCQRVLADPIRTPAQVHQLLASELRGLDQEVFQALVLDSKHRLVESVPITRGTLTASLVHPREVFRPAIRLSAAALVVAHNHPSGDPEPSAEDLAVTRRLLEAGRLLGIDLVDHVVIGDGSWVSIRERLDFRRGQ